MCPRGAEGSYRRSRRLAGPREVYLPRNPNEAQFDRYRNWQWIKHLALADYVVPWTAKLGSVARTIFIVDLFAGAATYVDGVTGEKADGSPVIFARQALRYEREHPGRKLRVICVERNQKNWESLCKRVGGFGELVTVLSGAFSRHIDRICSTIGNAPALILFDPIGLKPIAADTIRPLLHRQGKTDVFMILHFKVIHRTAGMLLPTGYANPNIPGAERAAEVIDAVFGTLRWRFIAKDPKLAGDVEQRERAYLGLYFEEVLGDRYEWKCAYPVRSTYFSKVQYWFVHASDHLDAHLLMNDEIIKLEDQLFGRTLGDGALEGFTEVECEARHEDDEKKLRERMLALVEASPSGTMTFGALRAALLPEFFGRVKQGAYSRAAKGLVREERVVREQRLHAKFDGDERLGLPPGREITKASPAA